MESTIKTSNPCDSENLEYKAQRLWDLQVHPNLYPHIFRPTITLKKFREDYGHLNNDMICDCPNIRVAGRIQTIRTSGSKLYFAVIESDGVCLQVLANAKYYCGSFEAYIGSIGEDSCNKQPNPAFSYDRKLFKRGDIIGVEGFPTRSTKGELSILPLSVTLLAPCLYSIPKNVDGKVTVLTDEASRFNQRYLDFIVHPENREIFKKRARVMKYIRSYLDEQDFLEVETPILSAKAGGANAKPFVTHHNDSDCDMYMRIAPELYLKQLVIGGFDKVYEIGKNFRNENNDRSHQCTYTAIEIYQTYAD